MRGRYRGRRVTRGALVGSDHSRMKAGMGQKAQLSTGGPGIQDLSLVQLLIFYESQVEK